MADSELQRNLKRLADPDQAGSDWAAVKLLLAKVHQQIRAVRLQVEENTRRLHALENRIETTDEFRAIARQTEENTRVLHALEARITAVSGRKPAGRAANRRASELRSQHG